MEKDRKGIKEPYEPEHTPKPPQKVKPTTESDASAQAAGGKSDGQGMKETARGPRQHLLDEQADIEDETTI